ncbi:MAG: citrate synthase [Phycisphaeraceae bacterium]|nr:citrate synthase [Phycisphaeraceae bacterium]
MPDAVASDTAKLSIPGHEAMDLPITVGSEGEHAIDVTKLRGQTGYITLDPGYRNTGSVESDITFIDGEKGILRYRGYAIADLCENCTFLEVAWLLIFGELPNAAELQQLTGLVGKYAAVDADVLNAIEGFPNDGHPMAKFAASIQAASCCHDRRTAVEGEDTFLEAAACLIAQGPTLAAAGAKDAKGLPPVGPKQGLGYAAQFLNMLYSDESGDAELDPDVIEAIDKIFILHADHEQNCSTSTVRIVGSSGANLFTSCAAGVSALWGPLHGGANVAVLKQLHRIHESPLDVPGFLEKVKNKEDKLFGFGHAVYKSFDPRAQVLKSSADKVLGKLGIDDPLLEIAKELEEAARSDDYFKSRNLYPNVDFYSGIIMRALGIPEDMFTVMFALGRMPGWIANWKEVGDQKSRIYRPRQVYTGSTDRKVSAIDSRG